MVITLTILFLAGVPWPHFAAIGGVIGWMAERIVDDAVRARISEELAENEQTKPAKGAAEAARA